MNDDKTMKNENETQTNDETAIKFPYFEPGTILLGLILKKGTTIRTAPGIVPGETYSLPLAQAVEHVRTGIALPARPIDRKLFSIHAPPMKLFKVGVNAPLPSPDFFINLTAEQRKKIAKFGRMRPGDELTLTQEEHDIFASDCLLSGTVCLVKVVDLKNEV